MNQASHLAAAASLDMDLDGVSLIEASAGTGKTYTIANLYLLQLLAANAVMVIAIAYLSRPTEWWLDATIAVRAGWLGVSIAAGARISMTDTCPIRIRSFRIETTLAAFFSIRLG